jgi:hypothetical protein
VGFLTNLQMSKTTSQNIDDRYLGLLRKCLTRSFPEKTYAEIPKNTRTASKALRFRAYCLVNRILQPFNLILVQTNRAAGETMMGAGALENLHWCMEQVLANGVPGDFVETGVWRGGGTIYMRAFLEVHHQHDRRVWVADSFEGLPKPNVKKYKADEGSALWQSEYLVVSLEEVQGNFQSYDLMDDQVCFLKGFFADTMPIAPIREIAVLRLDGDMYESTMVVLENLYPRLASGGFVIIDDYGMIPACNRAVDDYRQKNSVTEPLQIIGFVNGAPLGAYWQKR